MESLFEKRIGAYIGREKIWTNVNTDGIRASWPMSKIIFFNDFLLIKILNQEFRLNYKDIDTIKRGAFTGIQIMHHSPKVDKYVYLTGLGNGGLLFKRIHNLIKKNGLKIKIEK